MNQVNGWHLPVNQPGELPILGSNCRKITEGFTVPPDGSAARFPWATSPPGEYGWRLVQDDCFHCFVEAVRALYVTK